MDFTGLLQSREALAYRQSCIKVGKMHISKTRIPPELNREHYRDLEAYRQLLKLNGIGMPLTPYTFDCRNKKTWRYSDVVLSSGTYGLPGYICAVENPEWVHRALYNYHQKRKLSSL